MKYSEILDKELKCEFLIDLFETYDVDVIYSYDRLYENMDDSYSAEIPELGLEFIFDSSQKLRTLFMEKVIYNGYNPFEGEDPREISFKSANEALAFAKVNSIETKHSKAQNHPIFGKLEEWVKFYDNNYSIHFEFNQDGIEKVTLQSESE